VVVVVVVVAVTGRAPVEPAQMRARWIAQLCLSKCLV